MRVVEIENFRSLENVIIEFDEVTTFIGPNGSGKSSILHALDWFFNGKRGAIGEGERFAGAEDNAAISVSVTFGSLTAEDRDALGQKYAPAGIDTLTVTKKLEAGFEKMTGKALAFPGFERVRSAEGATAKRAILAEVQAIRPDLHLPKWTRLDAMEAAMSTWETDHPDELAPAEVSDTHFFGFNSEGKLNELFDYVFVGADLRAGEESVDSRTSVIGKILERALDRSAANLAIDDLVAAFVENQNLIHKEHIDGQLAALSQELTDELRALTSGRQVHLRPVPADIKPQQVRVAVSVSDAGIETLVTHQGHGFQRALLVAALKLLAQHKKKSSGGGVICLAIEEPELFQHPTQARAFAAVLRELAEGPEAQVQIVYATHSPYFIEPRMFDQVRRVSRTPVVSAYPEVSISRASLESTVAALTGFMNERAILSRWDHACLKSLPEALFAESVILVEGDDDKAILEGASVASAGNLSTKGVSVAAANGKGAMLLPHAILSQLGIRTLLIFDNDSGCEERMVRDGKEALDVENAVLQTKDHNRKILRYFGLEEEDWPQGVLSEQVIAIPDMIESMLSADWPEWEGKRAQIIGEGRGARGKNAATYGLAARECKQKPTGNLAVILDVVLAI